MKLYSKLSRHSGVLHEVSSFPGILSSRPDVLLILYLGNALHCIFHARIFQSVNKWLAVWLDDRDSIPGVSSPRRDRFWSRSIPASSGYQGNSFPGWGGKAAETWRWPLTSIHLLFTVEVRNVWVCASILTYDLMVWRFFSTGTNVPQCKLYSWRSVKKLGQF